MAFRLSSFWRNVVTLMSGTILSQVLLFASTPVLSRIYLPEAFGVMGAYLGGLLVLTVIANGGFELAIMLPARDQEAHALWLLSIGVGLLISVMVFFLFLFVGSSFLVWVGLSELTGWHLLLPASLCLESIYQACYQALNRFQQYKTLATSRLIKAILQIGISLILGLMEFTFEGLLIALIAGQLSASLFLLFTYTQLAKEKQIWHANSLKQLIHISKSYWDFPIYGMASNALNTAGKQLPYFFLPRLFAQQALGKSMSGNFQQTQKLLSLPIGVFAISLGNVFYERAGRALEAQDQSLARLTKKTTWTLLALGLLPSIIVMLFGPELFQFFLGKKWLIAGQYAQVLMPWFYLTFVAVPLSYLVDVKRKLNVYLWLNVLLFCGQFLSLWIGSQYVDGIQLMIYYGTVSAILVGLQIIYFYSLGVKAK